MVINHTTQSKSGTQNVTDNDVNVSDADISTTSDAGEKVFDASFGTKKTYRLYNYTAAHNETMYNTYDAVTRTCKIRGFAFNAVVSNCTAFLQYVPYALKHIHEPSYNQYNQDQTLVLNVTGANYLYIISYPTYSGYRIVHDPTYTYYFAPMETPTEPKNWLPGVGLVIAIIAIALIVGLVIKRRKSQGPQQLQQ
jgi:heme/copper-type cytochrome/quinol oxidase subunit 2